MRVAFLSIALAVAAITGAAAPAQACGMYEPPVTGTPEDRIAEARQLLDTGSLYQAARYARSVAHDEDASVALRVEAYMLAGVIRWKQGSKQAAKVNFAKARELDAERYETLVAARDDAREIRALVEDV